MRVLVLEPFYGGSHKSFLDGLAANLPFTFQFYTLPARNWKWRMRLAAPYYAGLFRQKEAAALSGPCCLLCSSYVDVAALRALAPARLRDLPLCTYFHENQFAYPVQVDQERDYHFALTNYTTALAADRLAFNSRYNLDSFLAGCRELLQKCPDIPLGDRQGEIAAKAEVLHPGIDFTGIDRIGRPAGHGAPVIVWNHRWEHDKNPELFFETLFSLDREGVPFRLIVLGQSFAAQPAIFDKARRLLHDKIMHIGYARSREEYLAWLRQGDVVVSTARHEFYGISIIEAVRAGCRPLLPARLSYPELFPPEYLFEDEELPERLRAALQSGPLSDTESRNLTDRFSWQYLGARYHRWLSVGKDENL